MQKVFGVKVFWCQRLLSLKVCCQEVLGVKGSCVGRRSVNGFLRCKKHLCERDLSSLFLRNTKTRGSPHPLKIKIKAQLHNDIPVVPHEAVPEVSKK